MSKSKNSSDVASKLINPRVNPCIAEHFESLACLNANHYNRDKCGAEFLNYQDCKTFWNKLSKKRRKLGIEPNLPEETERKQIIETLGDSLPYIAL